jgi:hypothetical protein
LADTSTTARMGSRSMRGPLRKLAKTVRPARARHRRRRRQLKTAANTKSCSKRSVTRCIPLAL